MKCRESAPCRKGNNKDEDVFLHAWNLHGIGFSFRDLTVWYQTHSSAPLNSTNPNCNFCAPRLGPARLETANYLPNVRLKCVLK